MIILLNKFEKLDISIVIDRDYCMKSTKKEKLTEFLAQAKKPTNKQTKNYVTDFFGVRKEKQN